MKPRYTASRSLTPDGTAWVMSFRHPLRPDARGRQGRKMRRGLNTASDEQAQRLIEQMNELLGDVSWHSPAKRAEADRRFDPIVVRAFFDDIEVTATNSWEVRNALLPLPTREEGYAHVLAVGPTGAGKTSLLRQLIGSHPDRDRFPSTSASRTTISDIEVIAEHDPEGFKAAVTFFSEATIHTNVHESVADACSSLWEETPDERLAERLLTHRDLRFRLGYVIGAWGQPTSPNRSSDDDWSYNESTEESASAEADGALPTPAEIEAMQSFLESCLKRIRALATDAREELVRTLDVDLAAVTGAERDAAQDLFEDLVQSLPDFDELVNDIMDAVRARFERFGAGELRTHANGWPLSWVFSSTDRDEFIRLVRRFSSNYAPAFGTLLTPLVDGIRIRGPFFPTFAGGRRPRLVLLDGEGLGHVGDPAAGLASRIARRFPEVDVILLVDSAKSPMLEAPASVLRAVAASGYQSKLAFAFTHFDLMKGQANLPTFQAQRAHVLSAVHQKLTSLRDVVGQPAVRAIERELDERCFMLGFLDRELTEKQRGPVGEILRLIDFCEAAIQPPEVVNVCPSYDTAGLVLAIQAAATEFHARWDAILFTGGSGVRKAHWTEVKAMNRRVVLDIDNGEYKDLRPVADLVARLSEWITKFLDKPVRWKPRAPTESETEAALSQVQRAVFSRLHEFVDRKLLRVPRRDWLRAFEYNGRGSTYDRASVIRTIYQSGVPIPGPALDTRTETFLREVRVLLHDAIREGGGELISDVMGVAEST